MDLEYICTLPPVMDAICENLHYFDLANLYAVSKSTNASTATYIRSRLSLDRMLTALSSNTIEIIKLILTERFVLLDPTFLDAFGGIDGSEYYIWSFYCYNGNIASETQGEYCTEGEDIGNRTCDCKHTANDYRAITWHADSCIYNGEMGNLVEHYSMFVHYILTTKMGWTTRDALPDANEHQFQAVGYLTDKGQHANVVYWDEAPDSYPSDNMMGYSNARYTSLRTPNTGRGSRLRFTRIKHTYSPSIKEALDYIE